MKVDILVFSIMMSKWHHNQYLNVKTLMRNSVRRIVNVYVFIEKKRFASIPKFMRLKCQMCVTRNQQHFSIPFQKFGILVFFWINKFFSLIFINNLNNDNTNNNNHNQRKSKSNALLSPIKNRNSFSLLQKHFWRLKISLRINKKQK